MSALGHKRSFKSLPCEWLLAGCDLNRSMQHLHSSTGEGGVENEAKTEDLLLRCTEGIDVGSLAKRRVSPVSDVASECRAISIPNTFLSDSPLPWRLVKYTTPEL